MTEHAADCLIRHVREVDLPAYKTLRDAMLARHPEAFTSDAETELRRDASSYRSRLSGGAGGAGLFTLGAFLGTRLIGAISAEREPRAKVHHVAHIVGMMVSDEMQGQGVGRLLLECALRLLQGDTSLDLVVLSVTAGNDSAQRLYERCGFARYGRLEGALKLPGGQLLDKDLMSRRLR